MLTRLRKSWVLSFIREQRRYMSLLSAVRLARFEIRGARKGRLIRLHMRQPLTGPLWLREVGSDTNTFEEVVRTGVYEGVLARLQSCSYILDVGANIGLASRLFAAAYPQAQLFAVEPAEGTFAVLQRNLATLAREGRAKAVRVAVWGASVPVSIPPPPGDRFSQAKVTEHNDGGDGSTVPGLTMADLVAATGFPRIDLLKIDVEGAEAHLFRGNLDWLNLVGMIAIEFHGNSRTESTFDAVVRSYGFVVDDDDGHTVIARRPGHLVGG